MLCIRFFESASASAIPQLSKFNAMELANTLWAFSAAARDTESNSRLLEEASEVIPLQIESFNAHDLAVTAGKRPASVRKQFAEA
jgi:hypothetical protein